MVIAGWIRCSLIGGYLLVEFPADAAQSRMLRLRAFIAGSITVVTIAAIGCPGR